MQQAGGVVNGSTRLDYTNYFQVLPSNALELALWLEADRMRSLDVSAENLKNQQNVVSEEVRVNVLNQPHAAFEWLDIWQRANTNWYNAHNFYGDLAELEAATLDDVRSVLQDLLRAEQRRPRRRRRHHRGRRQGAGREALRRASRGSRCRSRPTIAEPPQKEEKRFTREDKLARTPALAVAWHLPERMTKDFFALSVLDPLIVGDESARLYQKLVRAGSAGDVGDRRVQLPRQQLGRQGPDALHRARRLPERQERATQVLDAIEACSPRCGRRASPKRSSRRRRRRCASCFLEDMEGGFMPRFGRANLLAAFALFDDDPGAINTILDELDKVTVEDVKAAAGRWFVPTNRTSIDSRPVGQADGVEGGAR